MRVGFIGVGNMGGGMAANLLKNGASLTVYNRSPGKAEALAAQGAAIAGSPAELAAQCDVVLACLRDVPASRDVLLGEDGAIRAARPGTIIVDHGTVDLETTRACGVAARERGCEFLDAPISGGAEGAAAGTLSIMVGGDEAAFARALPYFEMMGRTVVWMGASGAGTATKLINQLLVAAHAVAAAEAFTLAGRAGLDIPRAVEVLGAGWAASTLLERNAPVTVARDFESSRSPLRNLTKDLGIVAGLAGTLGVAIPVTDSAADVLREAEAMGYGAGDVAATALVLERRSRGQTVAGPSSGNGRDSG